MISHENVAGVDCCGCLVIRTREDQADIVCNECAEDVVVSSNEPGVLRRELVRHVVVVIVIQ